MEYKKNDVLTVTIEDIGNDGEGIGKVDGFALFLVINSEATEELKKHSTWVWTLKAYRFTCLQAN